MTPSPDPAERFRPHAAREMANMFDVVSGRYDLLNRLMTLGQDGAWRAAMWRSVPDDARVVLDLCTGNGVSLPGLTRPGRLVIGADVSLRMLEAAGAYTDRPGWAPRLVCADAFHLPLREGSVDAITIAFGLRNLRPRAAALTELARVLAPGGTLVVLEACAPRPGPFAPFHRLHLRHGVPLLGRLSADPSAYTYLSGSVFEFGDGRAFEQDLAGTGFRLTDARSFLFGAARLWTARSGARLQNALPWAGERGDLPHALSARDRESSVWTVVQLAFSGMLFLAMGWGLVSFLRVANTLPLEGWQRWALGVLLAGGVLFFGARTLVVGLRANLPPPGR
jgi:demethylmenaquinone methyltransferase/2-methoxy-6-polyprenyl-1,4-benzoquinol methylase